MAMHEKFRFEGLVKMFQGQLPLLVDQEMKRVLVDCKDRFEDVKPRSVKIEFKLYPEAGTHGDQVAVEVEVVSSLPRQRTRMHTLTLKSNGEATFHPDLPDDPEGSTLYDPDTGEVKDPKRPQ